ncbi:PH domain-containing protein [Pseudanabaena sp. PCC 6802]|uniref:PH domain-containing protein n=1 Tax=Pseudanabaena sp. PCC 6802 TaxID=118173 RepID=UPI000346949C|nr:PH domain-containing protein [Pseudanabaena sp. PCC 6802]
MQIYVSNQEVKIQLSGTERFWAFHIGSTITIPVAHIKSVSTAEPASNWKEIRAPGAFIPGFIKSGTYYSDRGREFWYVTREKDYLILELKDEYYKWITLTIDNSEALARQIQAAIANS